MWGNFQVKLQNEYQNRIHGHEWLQLMKPDSEYPRSFFNAP